MPPPLDVEQQLRRHGDALRTLAAQLLRGPAIDDALQDLWLAAMRAPPREGTSVGGWLRTVLLHVVSRFRRQRARQLHHEPRAARGVVADDAAAVAAREEAGHRLLAAVGALEPVYRDVVWQRFFEGMAPRAIAACSGVPIATVKSRLQRGLGMLRERLGKDADGDWRAGLATAFGLGKKGAAAAALVTGGVLMTTWTKVTIGSVVAAAALLAWAWLPTPDTTIPATSPGSSPAAVASAALDGAAPAAVDTAAAPPPVREAVTAPVPAANDTRLATIRGRCVDEQGTPVANGRVLLNGWYANSEREDAWLRDHPKPEWKNPPAFVTGSDGAFEFTFWPPPPFQFALSIGSAEFAGLGARWSAVAEGQTIEFGDIAMVRGVMVQGRVVDEAGAPVANATIQMGLGPNERDGETPELTFQAASATSARDGSFQCHQAVRPGPYRLEVHGGQGMRLRELFAGTLRREQPIEHVVLVLQRPPVMATITGRVVDETGRPIANVEIDAVDRETGRSRSATTARDGSFTMQESVPNAGEVTLTARHARFEPARGERGYPWGSTDVVLTMHASGGLAVHVRDEHGTALKDFTVRAVQRHTSRWSSNDGDVRVRGPYAADFATVPGIARGSWTLLLEFPTASHRACVAMAIEKTANDTPRVDVIAPADVQRTIRVVDEARQPIAGANVQLCLPVENEFGADTYIRPMQQLFGVSSSGRISRALVLTEGVTGADGTLVVSGPPWQSLGLAVHGPNQSPLRLADVRLDDATPLDVTLRTGAQLEGTLQPTAALPALRANRSVVTLRLQQPGAPQITQPRTWFEPGFPVAADGTFALVGLEPGEWTVVVQTNTSIELGRVTLRAGEVTRFEPDLAYLVPGTLRGTLHKNGAPARNTQFQICGSEAGPFAYVQSTTDASGAFEVQVGNGTYYAMLTGSDGAENSFAWRSVERVAVVAGQTTNQPFHAWAGELKVIVRDAQGAPVPKLRIRVTRSGRTPEWLRATDAAGGTAAELGADQVTLAVLPKRLQDPIARNDALTAAAAKGGEQATEALFLQVATPTVVAGKATTVEVQLPAAWDPR
jgi:RNA polymerase sigma factor (sigma-70 family)